MAKRTTTTAVRKEQADLHGYAPKRAGSKGAVAKAQPKKPAQKPKGTHLKVVEPSQPKTMLQAILLMSVDPRVDVQKFQVLLAAQREEEARQAQREFDSAFIDLQEGLSGVKIDRDGKIEIEGKPGKRGQSTPYSTYPNIHRVVSPILRKHGFALSHPVEPTADMTRIIVASVLRHCGGHRERSNFPLPAEVSGSKNNVQGWGSAHSYGKRYNTIALLDIVSEAPGDKDDDGATAVGKREPKTVEAVVVADAKPEPQKVAEPLIDQKQHDDLIEAIEACGVPHPKVLAFFKIAKLRDLPAARYQEAIDACAEFKRKHGRG